MKSIGGGGYDALLAQCPACGCKMAFERKDDPKATTFRDWTTDEVQDMGTKGFKSEPVYCPVDGALCESGHGPMPGSTIVGARAFRVYCERCNREHLRPHKT